MVPYYDGARRHCACAPSVVFPARGFGIDVLWDKREWYMLRTVLMRAAMSGNPATDGEVVAEIVKNVAFIVGEERKCSLWVQGAQS